MYIIECGAQVSGGNYTDWEEVYDLTNIGFPIIAYPNGIFYVTKHKETGGLINEKTVKEQLLYEIGDPKEYITPYAIADFTLSNLKQKARTELKLVG